MSEAEDNKPVDADILKSKADILGARDIVPRCDKKRTQKKSPTHTTEDSVLHKAADEKDKQPQKGPGKAGVQELPQIEEPQAEPKKSQIPRFDLTDKILAEQRRVTAVKRKAPGSEVIGQERPKTIAADTAAGQPKSSASSEDAIIFEIVARDIKRLCHGHC